MESKRGFKKKFLEVLNSKPVIGLFIFIVLGMAMVVASDVIVKEGNVGVNNITFGTDTTLYRSAANTLSLATGDNFVIDQGHFDMDRAGSPVFRITTTTEPKTFFWAYDSSAEAYTNILSFTNDTIRADGLAYASTSDDLSDLEFYDSLSSAVELVTLVNVTGSGTLIVGQVLGYYPQGEPGNTSTNWRINITIDGTSNIFPTEDGIGADSGGKSHGMISIPPIHFDESLKISYQHPVTTWLSGYAGIKYD